MAEDVVKLKSTYRGLVDRYIKDGFWTIVFATGADKAYDWAQNIAVKAEASGIMDYFRNKFGNNVDKDIGISFLLIGSGIAAGVAAGFVCDIVGNFYRARTANVVDKQKGKITETSYGFPVSKNVQEIKFDRIIGAEVSQSTVDRIVNTGDLKIEALTYTNADSRKKKWTIPHINNPHDAKENVLAGLPDYTGLEVKMRDTKPTT